DHLDQAIAEAYPALAQLKAEGVIGAIGLGTNTPAVAARVLREVDLDHLLLAGRITLLDRTGEIEVTGLAAERGTEVLSAGVFNSGVLAAPSATAHFDYAPASDAIVAAAQAMHAAAERHGVPLIAA